MVGIAFINPLDQPTGRRRLLGELRDGLQRAEFSKFRMIVAFAKVGPLRRLESIIDSRRATGLRVEAIFGVDQFGTSAQALSFALDHFNRIYVTREPDLTFHPKIYAFLGSDSARVFIGSNNLTVGGTETNFETAVRLDFSLPDDASAFNTFTHCWKEMLPAACPATKGLDRTLLNELIRTGVVPDETSMRTGGTTASGKYSTPKPPRSGLSIKPPSALPPRKALKSKSGAAPRVSAPKKTASGGAAVVLTSRNGESLAIQIKPHHNGEIFLSVTAALQNPAFFKWPFNGATTPKKGTNVAYPQLVPDPVVNVTVYGANPEPLLALNGYRLNTVYYERKSEIRITASPLVGVAPDYSVMIMRQSDAPGTDYDITIHTPASPDYAAWVAACNQQMPGGGKSPRKFGWF